MRVDCLEREISYYLGHYQLYNRDYESAFTSRISPLSFLLGLNSTKKEFLSPPLSCFRYGGCWKQEPPRASDLPYQLLLIVLQGSPVFFSNGLFCLPTPDVSASEGDTKWGESTWVAMVTVPLNIQRIRVSSR